MNFSFLEEVIRGRSPYHDICKIVPMVDSVVIVNSIKSDFLLTPKYNPMEKKNIVDAAKVMHGRTIVFTFVRILLNIIMAIK